MDKTCKANRSSNYYLHTSKLLKATLEALHRLERSAMTSRAWSTPQPCFPSDLIITGDVDGLISRRPKHACFPYRGELLGPHQAEKGPFGHIHHDAFAVSLWRGQRGGGTNLSPKPKQGTGAGGGWAKLPVLQSLLWVGVKTYTVREHQGHLSTCINILSMNAQ